MRQTRSQPTTRYVDLIPFLQRHWQRFALGGACILGYVGTTLVLPYLAGAVSSAMAEGNVRGVAYALGLGTGAFLIRSLFQYAQTILMIRASLDVGLDLRQAVYAHLHTLNLDYFEQAQTGDLTYRLTEDIDRIGEIIHKMSQQFISSALQLIAIPLYMAYLNWQLTLVSLVLAPLMAWLIGQFGQQLLTLSRRSQQQMSNLAALLTEVLGSMRLVQAFDAQNYEIERFNQEARHNRLVRDRVEGLKALQYPVVGFLEAVSIMLLFLVGGWQIAQGNLSPQSFVSFLAAIALLLHPISLVTEHYNDMRQTEASVERVFEILHRAPVLLDDPKAQPLPRITGKVGYHQVNFSYVPGRPVLEGLDFTINPGEVVALVGSSGAGKTTLVNLLLRFADPCQGVISIDGTDLRTVTRSSLRRQVGLVPQDINLFSGTIAQNIAYGELQPDLAQMEQVARIANAHDFISQLSQGYHSWVGERGVTLSGGQRQRLAIARALYRDPRILILDEATSALDPESEALVREALERAMHNRTVVIIAHRLSTVRRADRILFLEGGQIVEAGSHTELLHQGGRYAQFNAKQFQG